jgi:hypothetical protein
MNKKQNSKTADISGPFIESLFRVSALDDGYVLGRRIKNDLIDCFVFDNDDEKGEAASFWKKLAQDLNIEIKGSYDEEFETIRFKRLSEKEYLNDLKMVDDQSEAEPLSPLEKLVYNALEKKFGNTWSYYLMRNVNNEMRTIQTYSLEGLYMEALLTRDRLQKENVPFFVPNSGVIGWLLDLSPLNPLLHYVRCPKCHYSHGFLDYKDLNPNNQKENVCPNCGTSLLKEGIHMAPAFYSRYLRDGGIFSLKFYVPKGYLKANGLKEEKEGEAMVHAEPIGYIGYIEKTELSYSSNETVPSMFANKDFSLLLSHYKPKDNYEVMRVIGLYLSNIDRCLGYYPNLNKTPVFREDVAAMLIAEGIDPKEAHFIGFDVSRCGESDENAIRRVKDLLSAHPELEEGWAHFGEILPLMQPKSEAIFKASLYKKSDTAHLGGLIGIFYLLPTGEIISKAHSPKDVPPVNGFCDVDESHYDLFSELVAPNYSKKIKGFIDDYAYYPRGRVIYKTTSGVFLIYADKCIISSISARDLVMKRFGLTEARFLTDEQYQCAGCSKEIKDNAETCDSLKKNGA